MREPFDFAAWLVATGWTTTKAADELKLTRETVSRMAAGAPVSEATEVKCREAARRLIERVQPYTGP